MIDQENLSFLSLFLHLFNDKGYDFKVYLNRLRYVFWNGTGDTVEDNGDVRDSISRVFRFTGIEERPDSIIVFGKESHGTSLIFSKNTSVFLSFSAL